LSSKYNLHYEKIGKETRCIEEKIIAQYLIKNAVGV